MFGGYLGSGFVSAGLCSMRSGLFKGALDLVSSYNC